MPGTEAVRVVVRVRPMNKSELERGNVSIIDVDRASNQVNIYQSRQLQPKVFAFDAVYDQDSEQQQIYDETGFPLVENVLEGYNGTIFAYGQTGCGKTFTMSGTTEKPGVIPNSFKHIFGAISDTDSNKMFLVYCSYIEIYNEEIRDLLRYDPKSKLELREDPDKGVYIRGVTKESVNTIQDINRFMDIGASHRTTKETMMNERSSRSHSIFTVYVEMSENGEDGNAHLRAGKLNLVDLAGSERQKKTQATGDRLKEAIEINLSLSALGNVISALVDGHSSHVPYRDSKLTRLLQDSLGGNTKTIMIAVASPADYNYDESLSTLRYASRAKFIQNKPKINEDPKDTLLREYLEEINKLKRMLAERGGPGEPIIVEKVVERIVEKRVEVPVYIESSAGGAPQTTGSALGKKPSKKAIGDESVSQGSTRSKQQSERRADAVKRRTVLEDDEEESPSEAVKPSKKAQKQGEMKLVQRNLDDDSDSEEVRSVTLKSEKQVQKQSRAKEEEETEVASPALSKTVKPAQKQTKAREAKEPEEVKSTVASKSQKQAQKPKTEEEKKNPPAGAAKGAKPEQIQMKELEDDSEDSEELRPVAKAQQSGVKGQAVKKGAAGRAAPTSPKVPQSGQTAAMLESDSDNYSDDFAETSFARGNEIESPGKQAPLAAKGATGKGKKETAYASSAQSAATGDITAKERRGGDEATAKGRRQGEELPARGGRGEEESSMKEGRGKEESSAKGGRSGEEPLAKGKRSGEEPNAKGGRSGEEPLAKGGRSGEEPSAKGGRSGEEPPAKGGRSGEEPPAKGGRSGEEPPAKGGRSGGEPSANKGAPGDDSAARGVTAEEAKSTKGNKGNAKRDETEPAKHKSQKSKGDGSAAKGGSEGQPRSENGKAAAPSRQEEGKQGRTREGKQGKTRETGAPGGTSILPLEDDASESNEDYADDFEAERQVARRAAGKAENSQKSHKDSEGIAIKLSSKQPRRKLQPQQSQSQEEFEDYGDDFEEDAGEKRGTIAPSESVGRMVPMRGGRDAKPTEAVRESKEIARGSRDVGKSEVSKGKRDLFESVEKQPKKSTKKKQSPNEDCDEEYTTKPKSRKQTVKQHLDQSRTEDELEESMQEKEARFANIKQKVMKGGQTQDQEELNRLKEYHRAQVKRQKVAAMQPRQDPKKAEEEQLLAEHKYASVQEEVENQRQIVKGLQLKYKSAMAEIQDLNHEHEVEKEDLLNAVRSKDRETNFLYQVLEKLISVDQLNMIKQKSKFDDDNNEWRVPAFLVQTNKPLTFPKLPRRQAQELVEADIKGRSIKFQDVLAAPQAEDEEDGVLRNARFQDWKKSDDRKRGESQVLDECPSSRGAQGGNMKAVLLDPLEQAPVVVLPADGGKNTPQSRKRLQPIINDPARQMPYSEEFPKAGKRSYIS